METKDTQRRYLISFESRRLPHVFTDVLVIGSGAAGLRAGLAAARLGEVILVAKGELHDTNTYFAQGGLAAVMDLADSTASHVADTIRTGCGLGDEEVIRTVIEAAPEHIGQMRDWGVGFDTAGKSLRLGREGGHSANRIVHANGDATGKALAEVLSARAIECETLKVWQKCFVIDLLTDPPAGGAGSACVGALTYSPRYGLQIVRARQTILAGGGAGMLWRETSNPPNATAGAMAMAYRAGAELMDAEMMQFHPTTLYVAGATRSLVSEAVRGEGGRIVGRDGVPFMDQYHELGDLAPRDVVSRAILDQMAKTSTTHVFLDLRHIGARAFAERFPQINIQCRSFGLDPGTDLIPVHPAAHYMIGGAKVDADGKSTLAGLLVCGEAACTGLHGANRLASNSLTEALVCGRRCGEVAGRALTDDNDKLTPRRIDWTNPKFDRTELDLSDICNSLRSVMWRNVGIVRREQRLTETLEIVGFWQRYVLDKEFYDPAGWETQNMLTAAQIITACALRRTESRGVHCREDFPETDPAWARHQVVRSGPCGPIIE